MIYTTVFQTSENLEQPREQDFLASTETLFLCCHILFYKKIDPTLWYGANYSKWNKKAQYLHTCVYIKLIHILYISQSSPFSRPKN